MLILNIEFIGNEFVVEVKDSRVKFFFVENILHI